MVRRLTNAETKWLMALLGVSVAIVLVASSEAFMMAKSTEAFEAYVRLQPGQDFSDYINLVLIHYMTNILEPILVSIYAFLALPRGGIHFYFRLFFGGMVLIRLVTLFFSMNVGSAFFYLLIILYIVLLFRIVKRPQEEK